MNHGGFYGFSGQIPQKPEISPGGSPIYRYETPGDQGWRPPAACSTYAEEITEHFEALFPGRESSVFHEPVSDLVHIDVNVMRPTAEKNFYVVYTTGMSDLPMTLPDGLAGREDLKYGMERLAKRFAEKELPLVLDIHRPNLCPDFKEIPDG